MSRHDKSQFAIVWQSLAVGLGFVWLFGFAIGYTNPLIALGLFVAIVACLVKSVF